MDQARDASVEGRSRSGRRSTSWCSTSITGNRRISLGLKQAEPNPWEMVRINHPIGSHIKGTVKNITDFGVFVGVDEGIDGLVHISDLHWTKKVKHPSELYKKGDDVEAVVLGIDVENERISLGVKQLSEDPWSTMAQRYPVGTPRARQGHQRHRLRRVRRARGGRRGPDPRLAAEQRAGRQAADAVPARRRRSRPRSTNVDAARAQDRAQHQGAAPQPRSARRSRPTCSASARAAASRSRTSSARSCASIATSRTEAAVNGRERRDRVSHGDDQARPDRRARDASTRASRGATRRSWSTPCSTA